MFNIAKLLISGLLLFAGTVNAQCSVGDAKIVSILQYRDGHIFVNLDREIGCACPHKRRVAFHKNDEPFIASAALAALTAQKKIYIAAEDTNCPVHGNTAKILDFEVVN